MHIAVAHAVAVGIAFAQGGELRRILVINDPGSIPAWYGVSLPGVYVAWGDRRDRRVPGLPLVRAAQVRTA